MLVFPITRFIKIPAFPQARHVVSGKSIKGIGRARNLSAKETFDRASIAVKTYFGYLCFISYQK